MWSKLKAFLSWDAFCQGCEIYHQMLVAAGATPDLQLMDEALMTAQLSSVPDTASIDIYPGKAVLGVGYVLAPMPAIDNVFHLN